MSKLTIYTAAQATAKAQVARVKVDAACKSGALRAADATPDSSRRSWRILGEDLADWVRAGMPTEGGASA